MGNSGGRIETVRNGEEYYLFNRTRFDLGPLAIMPTVEYEVRIGVIARMGDSVHMFIDLANPDAMSREEILRTTELTDDDMDAHAHYTALGQLNSLPDRGSFTAYADRRATGISVAPYTLPENIVPSTD